MRIAINGFAVLVENTRPDIATPAVLERFAEALALIERHQPWRLTHLRRDIREFWIVRFPSRGAFIPEQRSIITELTFLARRDITAAPVAASILHEGMHARMEAIGLDPSVRNSAREERICRRVELAFGESLPSDIGSPVIERAAAALTLSDHDVAPAVDWTEARRRQDEIDRAARQRRTD